MNKSAPSSPFFDPHHLHVRAFAEEGHAVQGTTPLGDLPRLTSESPLTDAATLVHWQARGSLRRIAGQDDEIWLNLQVSVTLVQECQRCLQPMQQALMVERSFRFVQDEAMAVRLDEEIEEDVLVDSQQFDLLALIEDELIMALPFAPRHTGCETAVALHDADAEALLHPFAMLQQLKKTPPQ